MKPDHLILACRDIAKAESARNKIAQDPHVSTASTTISVWQVDLASNASLQSFCARVQATLPALDALLLNAGVELVEFELTETLEKTLAVNIVGTLYLAEMLLPKLTATAAAKGRDTNLTVVGSTIHVFGDDAQLESEEGESILAKLSDKASAKMSSRYTLSKLMVHLCFNEMAAQSKVTEGAASAQAIMNIVNPGWCSTELARSRPKNAGERAAFLIFGRTPEEGSRTLVHAVTAGRQTHGCYLSECQIKGQSTFVQSARGRQISERLWAETKVRFAVISKS